MSDDRLRFRLFLNSELVDEEWIPPTGVDRSDAVADRHLEMIMANGGPESVWMVEVFDAGKPEEEAYIRYGTDGTLMVQPRSTDAIWVRMLADEHREGA